MIIALAESKRCQVLRVSGRMVLVRELRTGKQRAFDAAAITILWGEHK